MKRYICILVASTFLFSTVKAQLSYGVKGGGALTALLGDYYVSNKAGFYAGVFGAIPLRKSFSLQAELNYSAQGTKQLFHFSGTWDPATGYTTPDIEEKITYGLNYLNLPVLVKYKAASGFFVEAGLQAGLLVSAHFKTSNRKEDVKNSFKSFDLSGTAGIGYQLHNGLGMNLRYNRGLINITKPEYYYYSRYNSVAQLGLFYVLSKH